MANTSITEFGGYEDEINALNKKIEELEAKLKSLKHTMETLKSSDLGMVGLMSQFNEYKDQIDLTIRKIQEMKQKQYFSDLLKKYQVFSEQRKDIERKYDEDIKALESQRIKENSDVIDQAIAQVRRKKSEALSSASVEEFKSKTDFAGIFGNLDTASKDAVFKLRDQLKEFIDQSAGSLSSDDSKNVLDAYQKLDMKAAELDSFTALREALTEYKNAVQEVDKAQSDLADVQAGKAVIAAMQYDKATNKMVTVLLTQKQAEDRLAAAQNRRADVIKKINTSVNKMGKIGGDVVESGDHIVNMLSDLGIQIPSSISGVLTGLGQVTSSLASIDITKPFSMITGITGVIGGLGKTIGSFFGIKKKEVSKETIEEYEALMSVTNNLISKQKELLQSLSGSEAVAEYEKAVKLIEDQIAASKKLGKEMADSNASATTHSYGYRTWEKVMEYNDELRANGYDFSEDKHMHGLFELEIGGLTLLFEKVSKLSMVIDDNIKPYIDKILEAERELENLKKMNNEALAGISLDSAREELKNLLLDTDATMEDVAKKFEDYMRNSLVNIAVGEYLKEDLKKWYEKFAGAFDDDELSEGERKELEREYLDLYQKSLDKRDALFDIAGIDDEEIPSVTNQGEATSNFEAMSQDTGAELNGRFTALQISGENILSQTGAQTELIGLLNTNVGDIRVDLWDMRNIADEVRTIQVNSYLELQEINLNTANAVKELKMANVVLSGIKAGTDRI
ncbi:hypothetical protein DW107_08460 [Tannerella sp. AM09-19]|jgi:hypothetical protein|nr:hypothetical protein [Coprobacter fastidiosus]RHO56226.1 hypothetical protein DW107_08460 [Tannerella sp. AM09-19]